MPSQRFANTFTANQVIQNILAGSQFEFVGVPSRVQVYVVTDVVNTISAEITFGQELQIPASNVSTATAAGQGPVVPDDILIDDFAAPGDRIVIRLTEIAGGVANVARSLVVITPVG